MQNAPETATFRHAGRGISAVLQVLSCSVCLAGLQERVLYVPGFRYTGACQGLQICIVRAENIPSWDLHAVAIAVLGLHVKSAGWLALITSVSYTGFSLVERRCEADR